MKNRTDADAAAGPFHQLLVRYPAFLRRLAVNDSAVNLTFYVEDMAIECAQALTMAGIGAIHRMDHPRAISVSLSTLAEPDRLDQAVQALDVFLRQFAARRQA